MKQLTKSEFNKNGTTYKSVTSPASDTDFTQISDIGVKDDTFSYSVDGENFIKLKQEVVYVDDLSTIYQSPTVLPSSADIGTVLVTLINGEPPVTLYKYNGVSWVLVDQAKANTLYYSKQQKLIFTYKTSDPYFQPTSYTNTSQLTNGAAFVNAITMDSEINSAVGSEATLRSAADTALQASITALQNNKQDNLTAGDCVSIINNVISATGFKVLASDNVTISTLNKGAYQINAPTGGCDLYYSTQNSVKLEGDTTSYLLVTDTNKWVLATDSTVYVGSSTFAKELQTKLTAGANITIANDTISSTAGVVDSELSTTSENAVQNKVVTNALNGKYEKPVGGIPATDLASAVQTSLGKADTALQSISSSDVTTALGYTPYNATNPNGYTKVESSTTNGNIKINGSETTVYTLPSNIATDSDVATVQSNLDAEITARGNADTTLQNGINTINGKIPSAASTTNQLADKDFVNSSINAFAAYYITKNTAGDPFATKAELNAATTFYSGGTVRTPTTNDYCIVLADETKQSETGVDPTTRYSYQGNQWEYQYTINDTPLTAAQLNAINSGITSALVTQISTNQSNISSLQTGKQNAITSTSKLSADLVDDSSTTNKFVTTSEKNTWNGKQNALSTAQLNAVNSGVTSATVSQVATNTSNISSLQTGKQDKLTAGTNITIDPNTNTISATGGASITVDSALSTTSENPVQNKVITEAINTAQNTADGAVAKNTEQDTAIANAQSTAENALNVANGAVKTADLLNKVYPVGAIYMSENNVSPASFLGGGWVQIKDLFLLACGDKHAVREMGGEESHTLTIQEMPKHGHKTWSSKSGYSGNTIGPAQGSSQGIGTTEHKSTYTNGYWEHGGTKRLVIGREGGSLPHNNMPPYLAVYIWKRIG